MRVRRKRYREDAWRRQINRRDDSPHKAVANVVMFSVPIAVMAIAANLIMKMRDVYAYSFSASGIMGRTSVNTTEEDVIKCLTDFMNGKTDTLALMENSDYEPEPIFTDLDTQAMADARMLINILLVIGIVAVVVSFVAYFLLIRWRVKDVFWSRFKGGVVIFAVCQVINIAVASIRPLREAVYGRFIPMDFPDGDNLVMFLGEAFPRQVAIFEALAGTIMMVLLWYLTWHFAGRKKMFSRF